MKLYDEVHDLPNTAIAVGRWVGITHKPRWILCQIFWTSRASGWESPTDCMVIRRWWETEAEETK